MATRTSDERSDGLDFSLESRIDYLFAFLAAIAALIAAVIVIGFPLYAFYEIGVILGVGNPLVFAIGLYVIGAVYLWRDV